jgi:hypothetical protein
MKKPLIIALYLCLASPAVYSQNLSTGAIVSTAPAAPINYETARLSKVAIAIRINEKITLDGRFEEPAWNLALPATDFTQSQPHPGEPSRERTELRFLYDDDNLYVGLWCYDSDAEHITLNDIREDFNFLESDGVSLYISSLHDNLTGYSLAINAAGARRDNQITNDTQFNSDWDGVWDVGSTRNGEGYFVEYRIPFNTLRFSNSPTQEWGLNVSRRILRLNEESFWVPQPVRYNSGAMHLMGTLKGLENIHQGRNLNVKPFVTAGIAQSRDAAGELQRRPTFPGGRDYDGGVDVKYSLTPSLTLDGTYRTDFAQVEVDQQQVNLTRFNQFFPEKRDFFLENAGLFNFGNLGNSGNLVPFFSRRIGLNASGDPIPIVGGARITGKVRRLYDVGLIAMKTESSAATPSNNFLVGRLKRNLWRNTYVGALVTDRDSSLAGDYNRVYGSDAHFQFYDRLQFDSYLMRSDTPGKSGSNTARRFETAWRGDEWIAVAQYNEVEANFNPDVGFIRRKDVTQYKGDINWKPLLRKNEIIKNLNFETILDYNAGSTSGKLETREQDYIAGMDFNNRGSVKFTAYRIFDRLADPLRIPSGNPHVSIAPGGYMFRGYIASLTTSTSRKITGTGTANWGDFYTGRRKSVTGGLNLRPNFHLAVNLNYDRNQVTLPNGSFATNLVGARFIYGFNPRAFFNAYIQYNADTHQVSSNIRFDITHHPLSDLYIVYNDTRDTIPNPSGQRVRERAFIVKFTNLFSF